jgi:hypothetical protein
MNPDSSDESTTGFYENTPESGYVNIRENLIPDVGITGVLSSDVVNLPPKGNIINAYEKTESEIEDMIEPYLTSDNVDKYLLFSDDDGMKQQDDEYIAFKIIMESKPEDKIYYQSEKGKKIPVLTKQKKLISLSRPLLVNLIEDIVPDSVSNERKERFHSRYIKNKTKRERRSENPYGGRQTKKKYQTRREIKHTNKCTCKRCKRNKSKKNKKSKSRRHNKN